MQDQRETVAIDVKQSSHITMICTWLCPHCNVLNCTIGYPDDKELLTECHLCRGGVLVKI